MIYTMKKSGDGVHLKCGVRTVKMWMQFIKIKDFFLPLQTFFQLAANSSHEKSQKYNHIGRWNMQVFEDFVAVYKESDILMEKGGGGAVSLFKHCKHGATFSELQVAFVRSIYPVCMSLSSLWIQKFMPEPKTLKCASFNWGYFC